MMLQYIYYGVKENLFPKRTFKRFLGGVCDTTTEQLVLSTGWHTEATCKTTSASRTNQLNSDIWKWSTCFVSGSCQMKNVVLVAHWLNFSLPNKRLSPADLPGWLVEPGSYSFLPVFMEVRVQNHSIPAGGHGSLFPCNTAQTRGSCYTGTPSRRSATRLKC